MNRRILKLFFLGALAALGATSWRAWSYYRGVVSGTKAEAIDLSVSGAKQIDAQLKAAMTGARDLAEDLSGDWVPDARLDARLKRMLEAYPALGSAGLAFAPGAGRSDVEWVRGPGGTTRRADSAGPPSAQDAVWYARAALAGKAAWTAPCYRRKLGALAAVYAIPITRHGKLAAVLSASISLDQIKSMIEGLDLGPSGFPELISADGTYLYHPRNEFVIAQKTIFDLARQFHDKDRTELAPRALRGESGVVDHLSTNTGLRTWFIYEPIKSAGWSLQNTFVRADLPYDVDLMRRLLIRVMLAASAFILLGLGVFLRVEELDRRDLWTLSIVSSLVFLLGIAFIWRVALKLNAHGGRAGAPVWDRASSARVTENYTKECAKRHAEPPIFIPTGVFLETARFTSAIDIQVKGYIWQRYDDKTTAGLDRGFTLRDAVDVSVGQPYKQREDGADVWRWPFQALLHENLYLAEYPLDQETMALQLRHVDLDHNVVLTPDFASYKIIAATAKPGLAQELRIPGWQVQRTFFSLGGVMDNTTFGLNHAVAKEDFPGLQYNILLRRNLLDSFISNLGPIIIGMIILFALQMVMTSDDKLATLMQTTAGRLVNICVSMFFVIVFAHISVRKGMAAEEIFYLEYFYFITYLMILWVSINSIVYVKMKHVRWLQYEENLVPKLLFWPVVTGFLFLFSVTTFY